MAGITLYGAFEHEFQIKHLVSEVGKAFTLGGFQEERHFCEAIIAAMREAGVTPDTILKEFGAGQFEVTMGPQKGVTIADHSLITRELVGLVARADPLGRCECALAVDDREGVQPLFVGLDSVERELGELARGDLAQPNEVGELGCRLEEQLLIRHRARA